MRRLLLLATLCMAMVLVFAQVAVAQDDLNCDDLSEAEEQAVFDADPNDPNNLDDDDDGLPCEDDTSDNGSFALPTDDGDDGDGADENQYGPSDTQYGPSVVQYETEVPEAAPTVELPDTGGPSFAAFALPTLALLVAGGIFAARIVRR